MAGSTAIAAHLWQGGETVVALLHPGVADRRCWLGVIASLRGITLLTVFCTPYAPTARATRRRILLNCSAVSRDGVGLTRFIDTLVT